MISKYRSTKVTVDGIKFDSKKEARRYLELKQLEKEGIIKDLVLQPRFLLQPSFKFLGKTIRKIEYIADFSYFDNEKGITIIEDVKSEFTRKDKVYNLKKKLLLYKYKDIEFREEI